MKVAFHTLGCKVNQYETEAISEKFREKGYQVVDEREFADVYIINTCTVTSVADKKSRQYIRKMKKLNPDSVVAVTGCYAQIKPDEVSAVEGVDIVAGTNEKSRLTEYVEEFMQEGQRQIHIKGYEELDAYDDMGTITSTAIRFALIAITSRPQYGHKQFVLFLYGRMSGSRKCGILLWRKHHAGTYNFPRLCACGAREVLLGGDSS